MTKVTMKPKLGYVSARFPFAHAEQYFAAEVDSLSDTYDVTVFPTRATSRHNCYPDVRGTAHYLGFFDKRVATLAAREFARAPFAALRALALVAFGRCSLRARVVNLLLYPKALALASEVRRLGIEHLHVNWITSPTTIVLIASRLTGVPFSITAHQHDIFSDNLIVPKVRAAQFVRVISARNCRHLQDLVPPELQAKCTVVHVGVRLPKAAVDLPEGRTPRILCSARLCIWKGHRYLLEALARLRDAGVDFTCDLAGGGEIEAEVTRLVKSHRLTDRVRMLGHLPNATVLEMLERGEYDLSVLASTERNGEHEGIPVALMEAMAICLPVVATTTGSIPELVDERSGILVPDRDPGALAEAIAELLANPARRRELGRFGRERVLEDFESSQTTKRLIELLDRAEPWRTQPRPRGSEVPLARAMGRFGAKSFAGYSGEDHAV